MFLMVGGAGLVAAALLKLTVKDPGRSSAHMDMPGFGSNFRSLGSKRSYRHAILGGSLIAVFGASMPNFFVSYTFFNSLVPDWSVRSSMPVR